MKREAHQGAEWKYAKRSSALPIEIDPVAIDRFSRLMREQLVSGDVAASSPAILNLSPSQKLASDLFFDFRGRFGVYQGCHERSPIGEDDASIVNLPAGLIFEDVEALVLDFPSRPRAGVRERIAALTDGIQVDLDAEIDGDVAI